MHRGAFCQFLIRWIYYCHSKAELLQLNRIQFSSLGIFINKKVGNRKTETTFVISVLTVVYLVVLFFINTHSQERKLSAKKIPSSGNSALVNPPERKLVKRTSV